MTNGTSAPDPERRPGEDRAAQIERELIQFLAADKADHRTNGFPVEACLFDGLPWPCPAAE